MRRYRAPLLVAVSLALCAIATALFGPERDAPPSLVAFELLFPTRAILRESARFEVRVSNRGSSAIEDVGLKINRGYASVMSVIETSPRARIDDASTERRFYFGPLGPGESAVYTITVSPQRVGDFQVTARLVAARRGFDPVVLTDVESGRAEVTTTTSVAERPGR